MQGLEEARKQAKATLGALHTDRCSVYAHIPRVDETTHETVYKEDAVYTDLPCRLSYSVSREVQDGTTPDVQQQITMFLAPDYDIPPGCRIAVTRFGRTVDYTRSGEAKRYDTHQEIAMELWEDKA